MTVATPFFRSKSMIVRPELDVSYSNTSPEIHFVAPGTSITSSLLTGFGEKSGTSMATPHVSGAIAVLKSATPQGTVDAIESALRSSGRQVLDPRTNTSLTLIDVQGAVLSLVSGGRIVLAGPLSSQHRRTAQNTSVAGSKRVIIEAEPGTAAGSQELSRQLGADSTVSSLGPNTYRAEKKGGITQELIGRIKKTFGSGTKIYSDEPQRLPAPPPK
jgi:subtilisin family serine protease